MKIIPTVEYVDKRYLDAQGVKYLNNYCLYHLKITADILDYFQIGAGINNITDHNYSYVHYYPMAGRTYYAYLQVKY